MTTAACLMPASDQSDPNRVKVVFDKNQKALYFSRSLIPSNHKKITPVYRHLGSIPMKENFTKLQQFTAKRTRSIRITRTTPRSRSRA